MLFRSLVLSSVICSLAACGGGVSQSQYNYAQGAQSSETAADTKIASDTLPIDINGVSYASISTASTALNGAGKDYVATVDTGSRDAWKQGWTGKNVKVGIPDEFNSNGRWDVHGDYVTLIAASIAPEADFSNIDTMSGSPTMTNDQALAWFEDNGYHIINASFGIDKYNPSTGALNANFDTLVANQVAGFDQDAENAKNALIIYAAGNSGLHCPGKRLEDCDWKGAEIDQLKDAGKTAGELIIFVGALADGANTMAGYSIIAGDLMNDFIVAHDDVLSAGDGAGTSYASPRVAGAAALVRHKFPNLESAQLKQVLLQTATDLGATGVDATFGHGKLNIAGALSPQGTVVPK